jgi:hypothetical protein
MTCKELSENIEVCIPKSFNVAKFLTELNYIIATSNGFRTDNPGIDTIGILVEEPKQKYGILGLFGVKRKVSARWIGSIQFSQNTRWEIEVYGENNINSLVDLASFLTKKFNAQIKITLVEKFERKEQQHPFFP